MQVEFEIKKYNVDIYYRGKYFGCYEIETPDRDVLGYGGRQSVILSEDWIYKNKRLKKGTQVVTECVAICGKIKGDFKERMQVLAQSRAVFNE
jgi:hypothetical protein